VVIPQKLREIAKLSDKVLLVGCGDRMEIWDKGEYERFQEDIEGYGAKRREALARAYGQMVGRT
jgi:DNA-binding transcriptional regulator/RsmH inhibitor MraZ